MSDSASPTLTSITQQWVRSARKGDADGFARLYEHIAPAVFAWANLRMGADQRALLEPADLVQEVWLRAWRRVDDYDAEEIPFRFWVFRIAKNVLFEAGREAQKPERRRRLRADPSRPSDPLDGVADSVSAVSRRLAKDEVLAQFREAVEALPEDDRRLVVHCGLEGLPLRTVAERLEISEEAATKRWQRLRQRLRTSGLPAHLLAEDAE
ncbi:MAG: sigma-70 family RNA polymerase sigma factor [Planctomycetota bacterium]